MTHRGGNAGGPGDESTERPQRVVIDEVIGGKFRVLTSRMKVTATDEQTLDPAAWEDEEERAVDEKLMHMHDGDAYLWAAVDIDTGEVIAVMVSRGRSCFEALSFMRKVRKKCAGRFPRVFVDGGDWYPWALEQAGFDRWNVMTFGPRSAIERYFSLVDHRYRPFWERFPFRSTLRSLLRWVEAFGGVHNIRRSLS